jgi:hypothetical protein
MVVQANSTFNLHGSGNRTVTLGSFTMGYYSRSTTLNGGVYDMSLGSVSAQDTPVGIFAACNQQGTYNTTLTLAKGCIVTNANSVRLAYNTRDNRLKITDNSKVYAKGVNLSVNYGSVRGLLEVSGGSELRVLEGNFLDCGASTSDYLVLADTTNRIVVTGEGSKIVCPSRLSSNDPRGFVIGNIYGKNLLSVEDGGELVAPYRFSLGYSPCANCNTARFDNAKFALSDLRVGENGSCGNSLEIRNGSAGTFAGGFVGGMIQPGSNNRFVLENSTATCNRVTVSYFDNSASNSFYIAGADTSFTVTVHDLPRYPFVSKGCFNEFCLDGAEWNYFLNMQLDEAAASNRISFVNGARMNIGGGIFSGTNHVRSCGNRVLIANNANVHAQFCHISREDNELAVSNATLETFGTVSDTYNGVVIGAHLTNVDEASVRGNALVLRGDAPKIRSASKINLLRGSELRLDVPKQGFDQTNIMMTADTIQLDDSVAIAVSGADDAELAAGERVVYTVAKAVVSLDVSDETIAAANASLGDLVRNKAYFRIDRGENALKLCLRKKAGMIMLIR